MLKQVDVFYNGWGACWRWGSLRATTAVNGRELVAFEYSEQALSQGLELSVYTLPLKGPRLRMGFPAHQWGLPGPVYDALPDGWGMLLMDRFFKRKGLSPARMGALERLAYIGSTAMGAMSFEPVVDEALPVPEAISLAQLAAEVQQVQQGEGGEFLQRLLQMGGSPQGARPKVLLYRNPATEVFSTVEQPGDEAWLVKFPARQEHAEMCAVEAIYGECLRRCGIETPLSMYFALPNGQAAFVSKRFDRHDGMRVPMQSLAALTGADFRVPGALDYVNFLRATQLCTNDVRQNALAWERAVFNVVFNNRDDHPKNFAYLMSATGQWRLAPAYDVTFCEGPGGYHQMDVLGQALEIDRAALLRLGEQEAELAPSEARAVIERIFEVGSTFAAVARDQLPGQITPDTLQTVQARINENIQRLVHP